jgi:hypothetical protein
MQQMQQLQQIVGKGGDIEYGIPASSFTLPTVNTMSGLAEAIGGGPSSLPPSSSTPSRGRDGGGSTKKQAKKEKKAAKESMTAATKEKKENAKTKKH